VSDRPEIVCICGSTRFVDEMNVANRDLTLAGVIVVGARGSTVGIGAPARWSHSAHERRQLGRASP